MNKPVFKDTICPIKGCSTEGWQAVGMFGGTFNSSSVIWCECGHVTVDEILVSQYANEKFMEKIKQIIKENREEGLVP